MPSIRHRNRRTIDEITRDGDLDAFLRLRKDLMRDLEDIYVYMNADSDLSQVAFGMITDYLVDVYSLSLEQAAAIVKEFPIFCEVTQRLIIRANRHDQQYRTNNSRNGNG